MAAPAIPLQIWINNMATFYRAFPVKDGGGVPGMRKAARRRAHDAAGMSYLTLLDKVHRWAQRM